MTNLSPAAQAVKDAAQEMYADRMARKMAWPLDLPVVAAALRASADQVDQKLRGFSREACQEIRAIADELEAQ